MKCEILPYRKMDNEYTGLLTTICVTIKVIHKFSNFDHVKIRWYFEAVFFYHISVSFDIETTYKTIFLGQEYRKDLLDALHYQL